APGWIHPEPAFRGLPPSYADGTRFTEPAWAGAGRGCPERVGRDVRTTRARSSVLRLHLRSDLELFWSTARRQGRHGSIHSGCIGPGKCPGVRIAGSAGSACAGIGVEFAWHHRGSARRRTLGPFFG